MSIRQHREPDIEARVNYISTALGGRAGPVFSGYRPNHLVKPDYLTSGHHEYLDTSQVNPGESAIAHIWFLSPEAYPHSLTVGQSINVQEGNRLVGYAIVTKIFNPLLNAAS